MSGTPNNSTNPSEIEEEIPLDDEPEDHVITINGVKLKKTPSYFECTDEYLAFDGDYVEDSESSNS